jgi:Flp pilus assembly protein TadG
VKVQVRRRLSSARGQALLEAAMTVPLVLVVAVGIFEFGRAYQTWQVLTNAAREGARAAVLPSATTSTIQSRVQQYLVSGQVPNSSSATVAVTAGTVNIGTTSAATSIVTVTYPFTFVVLQPVMGLLVSGSTVGSAVTLTARAEMRNEQ